MQRLLAGLLSVMLLSSILTGCAQRVRRNAMKMAPHQMIANFSAQPARGATQRYVRRISIPAEAPKWYVSYCAGMPPGEAGQFAVQQQRVHGPVDFTIKVGPASAATPAPQQRHVTRRGNGVINMQGAGEYMMEIKTNCMWDVTIAAGP